ncbi:hypothetical protein B0T17DRAFT_23715 [Bombardia bombarda]|uniref:Transmembrane protein n=1 Tax=Bombardia bombarda TaxID=252184 RepID=A0AA39XJ37_9PEZI|nr:hypothetical protein B0T17DRAFT_23715 [Bombardia bombarda]
MSRSSQNKERYILGITTVFFSFCSWSPLQPPPRLSLIPFPKTISPRSQTLLIILPGCFTRSARRSSLCHGARFKATHRPMREHTKTSELFPTARWRMKEKVRRSKSLRAHLHGLLSRLLFSSPSPRPSLSLSSVGCCPFFFLLFLFLSHQHSVSMSLMC